MIQNNGFFISNIGTSICPNPTAWSEIGKHDFFSHFTMKGVDEQFDEIWLSLHPGKHFETYLQHMKEAERNSRFMINKIYFGLFNSIRTIGKCIKYT